MDTMKALAMKQLNLGNEPMVFDWDKAARLIKERKPKYVYAGLRDDWEWTGGMIYDKDQDGSPVVTNSYTYLESIWAVPEIQIDGEIMPCYVMHHERPRWDSHTKWPQSALDILNSKEQSAAE